MSLTLLALIMLPLLVKMVMDPKNVARALKEWGDSPMFQMAGSGALLFLALFILLTNPFSLEFNWESLISWIGVLTAVKGVAHLVPPIVHWKVRLLTEKRIPMFGFLGLLINMGMVYIDTQVL